MSNRKLVYRVAALVINLWLFANYCYWAMHQPQYNWVFDVNATALGVFWAAGIFTILISLLWDGTAEL